MNMEKSSNLLKQIHFARLTAILLLVNVLVLVFLVLPQRNRIASYQQQYASLRESLLADQKEMRNLKQRVELLQKAQTDLTKIYSDVLLPRKEGFLAIRLELDDLVNKLQIKREGFSYTYTDLDEFNLQQFKLSLPVQGTYHTIRKFINSIERSNHFLILDRVDLSSEDKPDSLNLDFGLSTYLVQDEK